MTVVPDEAANKILMLRAIQLKASSRRLDWARGLPLIKSRHLMQCPHIIMKRGKTGKGKAEKQESEVRSQESEGIRRRALLQIFSSSDSCFSDF
jgi:hypothetical protein